MHILVVLWDTNESGSSPCDPGHAGIQIILSVPYSIGIKSNLVGRVYMYESFDLNLVMAHCAIFYETTH